MGHFTSDFVQFFKELAANNSKEWFDENRKRYEKSVKKPFEAFVQELIDRVSADDPSVQIAPKDAIMRINRDIRFSKDKTLYKTHMSAIVSAGGKKDKTIPGIYVQLGPENVQIYGGAHMVDKNQLQNIREAIVGDLKGFGTLLNDPGFIEKFGELKGEQNKRIPAEFQAAGEEQPLVYNKNFYYFAKLEPNVIEAENLVDQLMEYYHAGNPMKEFLVKAISG